MPLINFKERFVPLIESGKKRQTIRIKRKNPIKAGDRLILSTGARTKQFRYLFPPNCDTETINTRNYKKYPHGMIYRPVIFCISADYIIIKEHMIKILVKPYSKIILRNTIEMNDFAKADGFNSYKEFAEFFSKPMYKNKQLQLIKW
jgi:hypothetical protein